MLQVGVGRSGSWDPPWESQLATPSSEAVIWQVAQCCVCRQGRTLLLGLGGPRPRGHRRTSSLPALHTLQALWVVTPGGPLASPELQGSSPVWVCTGALPPPAARSLSLVKGRLDRPTAALGDHLHGTAAHFVPPLRLCTKQNVL